MKKRLDQFEISMDKMLSESVKKTKLNESKYNTEIMDFIDTAHNLFKKLQSDKSVNPAISKQLFSNFKPLFQTLNKLVDTNEGKNRK